jgi:hypothetical protein
LDCTPQVCGFPFSSLVFLDAGLSGFSKDLVGFSRTCRSSKDWVDLVLRDTGELVVSKDNCGFRGIGFLTVSLDLWNYCVA